MERRELQIQAELKNLVLEFKSGSKRWKDGYKQNNPCAIMHVLYLIQIGA